MTSKKKYFVCEKLDIETDTIDIDFIISKNIKFLDSNLELDTLVFTDDVENVFRYDDLSSAIEHVCTVMDIDYLNIKTSEEAYDLISKEVSILRYNKTNDNYNIVDKNNIINCINQSISYSMETLDEVDALIEDGLLDELFGGMISEKIDIFYDIFEREILDECFTNPDFKTAIIQITDDIELCEFNVGKEDGKYYIGYDIIDGIIAKNKLYTMSTRSTMMAAIVRVITGQKVNNEDVCEVYGFAIINGIIENISYTDVKLSYEIDAITLEPIEAPTNLVYCDLNGNRLCSDD